MQRQSRYGDISSSRSNRMNRDERGFEMDDENDYNERRRQRDRQNLGDYSSENERTGGSWQGDERRSYGSRYDEDENRMNPGSWRGRGNRSSFNENEYDENRGYGGMRRSQSRGSDEGAFGNEDYGRDWTTGRSYGDYQPTQRSSGYGQGRSSEYYDDFENEGIQGRSSGRRSRFNEDEETGGYGRRNYEDYESGRSRRNRR